MAICQQMLFNCSLKYLPPTIDRILKPYKAKYKTKGRCTTKPGTLLKKHILVKTNQWNESRPGFMEADTVALCGQRLEGDFTYMALLQNKLKSRN